MSFREVERLLLAQKKVYNPASTDVIPWLAAVTEDVGVGATCFLQGISQDGQAIEGSLIVNGLGKSWDGATVPRQPSRINDRRKRIEEVTEQVAVGLVFCFIGAIRFASDHIEDGSSNVIEPQSAVFF